MTMTAAAIAGHLRGFAIAQIEALLEQHAPSARLPRMLAGHAVGSDVRADLAFTLGHLATGGVTEVAGLAIDEAIATVLRPIDGPGTHTFFSYRVAETLARYGPADANTLIAGWTDEERANVMAACDSSAWIAALDDGSLPANYNAVLARCELARQRLGLPVADAVVDGLVNGTERMLATNPLGFLDDDRSGGGRYDIYSLDVYLFTEPFRDRLPAWDNGFDRVLDLVSHTATRSGAAIAWGRSTGLLGLCHLLEAAALAANADPPSAPTWLARAALAAGELPDWFRDGLTTAHQHRSPYRYRGPARRVQLTLDALGKVAWVANCLERLSPAVSAAASVFRADDTWTPFEDERPLGVWAFRSHQLAFSLPVVGTAWSDYLPAPRNPGLFETPVDRPLAVGTPTVHAGGKTYVGGGAPVSAAHATGSLRLHYDGFPELGGLEATPGTLAGSRAVTLTVDGRTLTAEEQLSFDAVPDAVTIQIAEAAGQPLVLEAETDHPHTATTVDTDGIAEWRSFWGELPRVHQIDLEPARAIDVRWSVTPVLRVAADDALHWYPRSLYDPMAPFVADRHVHPHRLRGRRGATELRTIDVYHFHWPEWIFDTDVEAAERFLDTLAAAEIPLVWTQHNLLPHRDGDFTELYRLFAARADAVIHHSSWGRARAHAERPYRTDVIERVIPHGHWAALAGDRSSPARAAGEAELGLAPCELRIGVVGAPRPGKDTVGFVEAFARSTRDDLQLVVLSLDEDDVISAAAAADPRITALPYDFVDREVYNARLATIDALAFPFDVDTQMLTTGVFADAIGAGLPALVTGWGFLTEMLGAAGIPLGDTPDEWTAAIERLDPAAITAAAEASIALQPTYDWTTIAHQTKALLDELPLRV